MIIIATHTRFDIHNEPVHGTGTEITTFLESKKKEYIYIQHSLFNTTATVLAQYSQSGKSNRFIGITHLPFFLKLIQEFVIIFYVTLKIKNVVPIFLAVDPFNACAGIILKKIGKVNYVIYYTADYSPQRFENKIMNYFYHGMDRFSVFHADQVWNVSTRIQKVRRSQGLANEKNIFVPNSPAIRHTQKIPANTVRMFDLIVVSHITRAINFPLMIEAVGNLSKIFTDIRLLIIGNGEYKTELENLVKTKNLQKHILFLGYLSHEKVLDTLLHSGIGVALYTNQKPWTKYGDSMKVREYLACGLPVILTDVPSTAEDIKNEHVGIVIKENLEDFQEAVVKILQNRREYERMRMNAKAMSRVYDFHALMEKLFPLNLIS